MEWPWLAFILLLSSLIARRCLSLVSTTISISSLDNLKSVVLLMSSTILAQPFESKDKPISSGLCLSKKLKYLEILFSYFSIFYSVFFTVMLFSYSILGFILSVVNGEIIRLV